MLSKESKEYLIQGVASTEYGTELWNAINTGGNAEVYPGDFNASGIVHGDVVVFGNVNVTGDVTFTGDVICYSYFVNSGGHNVFVQGDCFVGKSMQFNTSAPNMAQSGLVIAGDFICGAGQFKVNAGQSPHITVGGSWYAGNGSNIDCSGYDGAPGMNIQVYGNFYFQNLYINSGNATASLNAGTAGSLTVWGDCLAWDELAFYGGDSNFANRYPGNGGNVQIYGDFQGYIIGYGGSANNNASGGDGGYVYVGGNLYPYYMQVNGGNSASTLPGHSAGRGGYVSVSGDIVGGDTINCNGGAKFGVVVGSGSSSSPDGGNIQCSNVTAWQLLANGGDVDQTNPSSSSGNGGYISIYGTANLQNSIIANAGNGGNNGGNGGYVYVQGFASAQASITVNGGNNDIGTNGSAGHIVLEAGLSTGNIYLIDGQGSGAAPTSICGIQMAGSNTIFLLYASDRTGIQITRNMGYNVPCTLLFSGLGPKQVLTNPNGSNTGNIAAFAGNLFVGNNNGWGQIVATPV